MTTGDRLQMDQHQAFAAMTKFLEEFFDRTQGDMATLMTDLELQPDGTTFDPAAWADWIRCVRAVLDAPEPS